MKIKLFSSRRAAFGSAQELHEELEGQVNQFFAANPNLVKVNVDFQVTSVNHPGYSSYTSFHILVTYLEPSQ